MRHGLDTKAQRTLAVLGPFLFCFGVALVSCESLARFCASGLRLPHYLGDIFSVPKHGLDCLWDSFAGRHPKKSGILRLSPRFRHYKGCYYPEKELL